MLCTSQIHTMFTAWGSPQGVGVAPRAWEKPPELGDSPQGIGGSPQSLGTAPRAILAQATSVDTSVTILAQATACAVCVFSAPIEVVLPPWLPFPPPPRFPHTCFPATPTGASYGQHFGTGQVEIFGYVVFFQSGQVKNPTIIKKLRLKCF